MPQKYRYLSKSRFKEAWECPTRLFYTGKSEYGSNMLDDPFLRALAEGGFQVGALAQRYYPDGILVETLDSEAAALQTTELMQRDVVTIFEGAVKSGHLLARVDIIVKRGNKVSLVEVKSKSFDSKETSFFLKRPLPDGRKKLDGSWVPYIADVGFQTIAFQRAYPHFEVTPYLMLADKSRTATVSGLHQKFLLQPGDNGRSQVIAIGDMTSEALGDKILKLVEVSREIDALALSTPEATSFADHIDMLATAYHEDRKIAPILTSECRNCPYRIGDDLRQKGKKSGFDACWSETLRLPAEALQAKPLAVDMGRLDVEALLADGVVYLEDVCEHIIRPKPGKEAGLSFSERRWLQVSKLKSKDSSPYVDRDGLAETMASWTYPLHMIDFETMMAAIPFYRGARPYEQVAFQFSHHTVSADGTIAHQTQWIETTPGAFPNVAFVRALRQALGNKGTVLRYAAHENTVLCQILKQMEESETPPSDMRELSNWIRTITHSPHKAEVSWEGERDMVDMLEMVRRFDYHPQTKGSNSIKYVLPAILDSSKFLQTKYSKPIYGAPSAIASHNFSNMAWVRFDGSGRMLDPYHMLSPVYGMNAVSADSNNIYGADELRNGGAAMTAFERMQFTQMTDGERNLLREALLRYCELDTFAMVMLYEYWKTLALDQFNTG